MAVFLITAGRLGALYGRKRMFLAGMAVFIAGPALCESASIPSVRPR